MVGAAEAMRNVATCLGFERTSRLLILVAERFRGIDPLDGAGTAGFGGLAHETVESLRPHAAVARDIEVDRAEALAVQWETTFHADPSPGFPEASAEQHLRPEVLATLSAEQRLRLEKALADGRHAYEVLLDLEANSEVAADLIAWLSSAVETITSRTVYRNGANCFEFLIFSEHAPDWVQAQLAALDPEPRLPARDRRAGPGRERAWRAGSAAAAEASSIRAPLIRVRTETIDELMAEVGEMRTALASLADIVAAWAHRDGDERCAAVWRSRPPGPGIAQTSRRHGSRSARPQGLGAYA